MLSNKKLTFAISLLVAIALWVYVIGTKDPVTKKQINNVPVTFQNTEVLQSDGLAVASLNVESIDVTVSANKSKIEDIETKNVKAVIDAGQLVEGDNKCKISVSVPEEYTCEEQSVAKADVVVETAKAVDKDVKVVFSGQNPDDKEATVKDITDKKVTVVGAESLIGKVSYVQGTIDASKVNEEEDNFNVGLKAVDADGNEVKYMSLSKSRTTASAILYSTKNVELEVPINKGSETGVERNAEVPKTVTIKGKDDVISKITKVKANTLDISKVAKDTTLDIQLSLPEGVMLSDNSQKLQATVTVSSTSKSRTLDFSFSDISIKGNTSAKIADGSGKVTITGDASIIDKLTVKDLGLYVEIASDAAKGTSTVTIMSSKPNGVNSITFSPEAVSVTI